MRHTSASLVQMPTDPASGAHNPGEYTINFCALREGGCTCGPGASSCSPARSSGPPSQRPVVEARGHWADFRCRPWHEVVRAVRCLPAARHRSAVSPSRGGIFGYLVGVVVIYIRAGGRGEGGGALGSSHIGRALGRSSTIAWYPLSAPLSRRLTGTHRMSMRCGYIGDNALQEEASARRGRYGAVLEASYSPIGGR
jgi:hypothetical protein